MATKAQKTKVGLFLLASVVVITVGVLIALGLSTERKVPYYILFDESVLGLGVGGLVEYGGVEVGDVKDIHVTPDNRARVDIVVSEDKVRLKEGVTATLTIYSLALGTMCVSLEGGDPEAAPLQPYEQIPSRESMFESVSSRVTNLLTDLTAMAHKLNVALEGLEEGQLAAVVGEAGDLLTETKGLVGKTSDTVSSFRERGEEAVADFRALTENLNKFAESGTRWLELAEQKVKPLDLAQTEEDLQNALEAITASAEALTKRLEGMTDTLDATTRAALHEADNVEYNLREGIRSLNETMGAVRDFLEYLKSDPAALIRGKASRAGGE